MAETISDLNEHLRAVRRRYLRRCRRKLESASQWVRDIHTDSESLDELQKCAHDLAGSGATLGFPGISEIAGRMEVRIRKSEEGSVDQSKIRSMLEELKCHVDTLDADLPQDI